MILKSSARGGALDLALHLSNAIDNERVTIKSVSGATSDSLYDAFKEWDIIASQSKATKPFYSLSINPDPHQRDWTDQEWDKAIATIEQELGLKDQSRAVVFHDKLGASGIERRHCHVVWSRINGHTLKAIPYSHDRYKLQRLAKDLAKEFELDLRWSKETQRENQKRYENDHSYDHAKSHGLNRDTESREQRQETLTTLWEQHTDKESFVIATRQAGYIIAQGDRRGFVVVDKENQIHSLARQVRSAKTKDIKARLGDPMDYPTLEQAKEEQRILAIERKTAQVRAKPTQKRVDLTKQQKLMAKLQRMAQRADRLHTKRRRTLKANLNSAKLRHNREVLKLKETNQRKTVEIMRHRKAQTPRGLFKAFRQKLLQWKYNHQDKQREQLFAQEHKSLKNAQSLELERISRYKTRILQQEKREAASLKRLAKKLEISHEKITELERSAKISRERQKQNQYTLSL